MKQVNELFQKYKDLARNGRKLEWQYMIIDKFRGLLDVFEINSDEILNRITIKENDEPSLTRPDENTVDLSVNYGIFNNDQYIYTYPRCNSNEITENGFNSSYKVCYANKLECSAVIPKNSTNLWMLDKDVIVKIDDKPAAFQLMEMIFMSCVYDLYNHNDIDIRQSQMFIRYGTRNMALESMPFEYGSYIEQKIQDDYNPTTYKMQIDFNMHVAHETESAIVTLKSSISSTNKI